MNVNTTSDKDPADLMNEVRRVLNDLSLSGVRYQTDPTTNWVKFYYMMKLII